MKLLGNTVLQYGEKLVSYEISQIGQMVLFKPYFYSSEQDFPCIVLNHVASGWQLQQPVGQRLEKQIREDVASLRFPTASTLFTVNEALLTPPVETTGFILHNVSRSKRA